MGRNKIDKRNLLSENIRHWFDKYPVAMADVYCMAILPPGWESLAEPIVAAAEAAGVGVDQIKEKFGGLRIYLDNGTDELYKLCDDAERESLKTCQECGQRGTTTTSGWRLTLCDTHHTKRNNDRS